MDEFHLVACWEAPGEAGSLGRRFLGTQESWRGLSVEMACAHRMLASMLATVPIDYNRTNRSITVGLICQQLAVHPRREWAGLLAEVLGRAVECRLRLLKSRRADRSRRS